MSHLNAFGNNLGGDTKHSFSEHFPHWESQQRDTMS